MLNADRVWYGWNRGCMWSVAREETVKGRPGYKRLLHEARLKPLRLQIIRCQSLLPEGEGRTTFMGAGSIRHFTYIIQFTASNEVEGVANLSTFLF